MPSQPSYPTPPPLPSSTVMLEFINPTDGKVAGSAEVTVARVGQICLHTAQDIPAGSLAIIPSLLTSSIPQVQSPPTPPNPPKFSSFDHP